MKFGMSEQQFQLLNTLLIQPLKHAGCDVYIFGSRARGSHHSHSDVDVLYNAVPGKIIQPGIISQAKEAIEESNFPFAVDLVCNSDLADSYRESVWQDAKPLC